MFKKILETASLVFFILIIALSAFMAFGVYHPSEVKAMDVTCPDDAPQLQSGQPIKGLT